MLPKKLNRPTMLIALPVAVALAAVFFLFYGSPAPVAPKVSIPAEPEPIELRAMSPEAPVFALYPPVIHATGIGQFMLSTSSFFYRFRHSPLPYEFYPPGSDAKVIITNVKISPHASLFPTAYTIQYLGNIVRGTESNSFEMEETNDWPMPMEAAIVWQY